MGYAKVYGAQTQLLSSTTIHIEADISRGLHSFVIVGLANKAVEESRDRVAAAIKNSGFTSPKQHNRKVVISLSPADIKKEGPIFDVAIAMSYLLASEEIKPHRSFNMPTTMFLGELSLDGRMRPIKGMLPIVLHAKKSGFKKIFIPHENIEEAQAVEGIEIYGAKTLSEVIVYIQSGDTGTPEILNRKTPAKQSHRDRIPIDIDFKDIHGQDLAKRGLEIAAAGRHNIALYGPPGSGKTMLAKAFRHILPDLDFDESMEVTSIYSTRETLQGIIIDPPFRAPHHISSISAICGGGNVPRAGEITLAHKGVLFLDEFPEFERGVIEALREPLEEKTISIARAGHMTRFPADIILIAAMNPCPCGFYETEASIKTSTKCVCTRQAIMRYRKKLSGPIIDRIDMWINVPKVNVNLFTKKTQTEATEKIRKRVQETRRRSDIIKMDIEAEKILSRSAEELELSARRYKRIVRLAQTIACMESSSEIRKEHILEALQYRPNF